jgi:hypothetical protein
MLTNNTGGLPLLLYVTRLSLLKGVICLFRNRKIYNIIIVYNIINANILWDF